ncbi:MAG: MFS transporter, partial [Cyanobacteria bacterium J06642_2]
FLARMGVGVGESTIAPCAHSLMADTLSSDQLSKGFAIYSLGAVIGGALAYIVGGPLIAWAATAFPSGVDIPLIGNIFSWQIVFVIVGLPGIVIALLFVLTVNEPRRSIGNASSESSISLKEVWAYLKSHRRAFLSIYGGIAILQIAAGGFSAWLPAMLERRFDIGPAEAPPYLVFSFILPGFASAIAAGWFGDRLLKSGVTDSHLRICAYSTLICILPFGLAPLLESPQLMTGFLAIGFFFAYMHIILCPAALQLISPPGMRSVIASLVMVSQILIGAGTGPIIVALITDFGFGDENLLHVSIVIVTLVCTSLAAIAFFIGRKPFGELIKARNVVAN